VELYLGPNKLTGNLPDFGNLEFLEQLWVFGNKLEGAIPDGIASLPNLRGLLLENSPDQNNLTASSTFLNQVVTLFELEALGLSHCGLTGPIPTEIGMMPKLKILRLDHGQLTGILPDTISNIASLGKFIIVGSIFLHSLTMDRCNLPGVF
jgi:Leucine-rich repeat (LRR) protein